MMLWNEVKRKLAGDGPKGIKFDQNLVDAFLYAMVKGGFFDAVMQVVEKSKEMKIFVDKWRYKQAFMETHKKLKVARLRKKNVRKMEALIAFKNWAGLNAWTVCTAEWHFIHGLNHHFRIKHEFSLSCRCYRIRYCWSYQSWWLGKWQLTKDSFQNGSSFKKRALISQIKNTFYILW